MKDDCIFCKIIKKESPSNIVYEDSNVFAFRDIQPQAKHHILVIPKKHIPTITDIESNDVYGQIFSAIKKIAKQEGMEKGGYRVCINNGPDAGQTVFHVHFHVIGGEKISDKMA
ncbi:MAG: histidine triad nucleotide-binding protein [Proteobacteria bacterium]|nr:histidine triad nucleotide-binding protein [Pseudomonadota bacterium]